MRPPQGRSSAGGGRRPRGATRPGDRRMERSRAAREGRRQRLAIVLIGCIIAVVAGIIAFAYFQNFIAPPRAQAAKVRDTVYSQGDLVKRLRLIRASTGSVDLSRAPWVVLFGMVEAELIRQGAEFEGVAVTDEDVTAALRDRFYVTAPEGQEVEPGQLETEYQERYQAFLNEAQIKDEEYRVLVSDDVHRATLREVLGSRIPEHLDHVELSWIELPHDQPDPENPPPTPKDILSRLETEEFADVAANVGGRSGYQGWVPKGAHPELDDILFGSDDPAPAGEEGAAEPGGQQPLGVGEFSDPITGADATYILTVLSAAEVREVGENWLPGLKEQALQKWIQDQWALGRQGGWVEVHTSSEEYAWVVEQYNKSVSEEQSSNQSEGN